VDLTLLNGTGLAQSGRSGTVPGEVGQPPSIHPGAGPRGEVSSQGVAACVSGLLAAGDFPARHFRRHAASPFVPKAKICVHTYSK
uniref:Uncharacterized protein n=1 Tax=Apteryx owenii TaxID=8824 RepID=A0A8B9PCP8_APTOW